MILGNKQYLIAYEYTRNFIVEFTCSNGEKHKEINPFSDLFQIRFSVLQLPAGLKYTPHIGPGYGKRRVCCLSFYLQCYLKDLISVTDIGRDYLEKNMLKYYRKFRRLDSPPAAINLQHLHPLWTPNTTGAIKLCYVSVETVRSNGHAADLYV